MAALHAFYGCDTVSAFKGKGKATPIKLLKKNPKFEVPFILLGDSWDVPDEVYAELEEFTCKLYGGQQFKKVDNLRVHMLRKKCGVDGKLTLKKNIDMASLTPCRESLKQHIKRTIKLQYGNGPWKIFRKFPNL
jgi:hypothetical protein